MAARCNITGIPNQGLADVANRPPGSSPWSSADGSRASSSAQVTQLVRALERDVIPRLARSHRAQLRPAPRAPLQAAALDAAEIEAFAASLVADSEAAVLRTVDGLRRRGLAVETLYLELFSPAALHLGLLWEQDDCDFASVTVGLGRLQRLLRELSPAFGAEVDHPSNGRRAMLVQPPDEQHSFGLSMVAEFFRRAGWDVHGGPGGAARNPSARVGAEWFDLVGFSIGSETRLDWLRHAISGVRKASRNETLVVMVGGPLFVLNPQWCAEVGADATSSDGKQAPVMAENLVSEVLANNRVARS